MTDDTEMEGYRFSPSLIFGHHDAHPVVLATLLFKEYDVEWLEWEPDVLWFEIEDDFSRRFSERGRSTKVTVSSLNRNKIQAVRTLLLSNGFWDEWQIFCPIIQAMNNNVPVFDMLHKPSVAQLMTGLDIVSTIRQEEFSEEISRFVAASCLEQGVWLLLKPLDFAQGHAARPHYECKDCGNQDEVDLRDGRCDVCVGRFSTDADGAAMNMKPAEGIADSVGRNLKYELKNDPRSVQAVWDAIKKDPEGDYMLQDDVPEHVVCAKLLVAENYMEHRRELLHQQVTSLEALLGKKL